MGHERTLLEERLESKYLGHPRVVRISLPPGYAKNKRRRYPVLYLHDGQNVFSSAGPDCCFGWGNWEVDLTATRLAMTGKMADIILVGIDHSRSRYNEYRGPGEKHGDDRAFHDYSNFLIKELKPFIDEQFRTRRAAAFTGVMGASLGGICSVALAWQHPAVFGLAACISGSFQIEHSHFLQVLQRYRGRRKSFRIYLDSGTVDADHDDDGCAITTAVATELRRSGWKDNKTLLHFTDPRPMNESELAEAGLRRDKWGEALGSQHNEFYWRLRLWRALTFLYPCKK